MSVFFILFSSCENSGAHFQEEIITIDLPQWPPEGKFSTNYPPLSKWKINIKSADFNNIFYYTPSSSPHRPSATILCKDNTITLKVLQNTPLSITAEPITTSSPGKEINFFKPAGYLYPYCQENKLTWNNGFPASILNTLFNAKTKNNASINNFIKSFNWFKFIEIINNKIENKEELYNPWLLNRENILRKISEKKFSAVYLNLSSVYLVQRAGVESANHHKYILSSFIPLNNNEELLVKKSQPQQFLTSPEKAVTITYISSKNVSLAYSFLPIFIEGL